MPVDDEYDLKASVAKISYLYPVLKDAHGNVVDGYHRLKADPNWPTRKIEGIKDVVQLTVARLVSNCARREVSEGEKREWLRTIAKNTGWTAKQIAEVLPFSYNWVVKYLPEKFKDKEKSEVGRKGGLAKAEFRKVATRRVAESDTRVECECCGLTVLYPKKYGDATVCSLCFDKLEQKLVTLPEKRKRTVVEAPHISQPKAKDMWAYRSARRKPAVSLMEALVSKALTEKKLSFISQRQFCVRSTIADFYFPKQNLAVYLDGFEAHKNRQHRDEQLRELLTKHGVKVLSLTYKTTSKTEVDKIVNKITEALTVV